MNIHFDIDGCIRDLTTPLYGFDPPEWDFKQNNKGLVKLIYEDLTILETALATKYTKLVALLPEIHLISCQPKEWQPYTIRWIGANLPVENTSWTFVSTPEEKLALIADRGCLLVEDYPKFSSYENIILIHHEYNRGVECKFRVRTVQDLRMLIF